MFKSKTTFFHAILSIALLAGVVSCKGPAGSQGPVGPQGPVDPSLETLEDGFINFTVSGNRQDGTAFSYTESQKTYMKVQGSGTVSSDGMNFRFGRAEDVRGALFGNNYTSFNISKSGGTTSGSLDLGLEKSISASQLFRLSVYGSSTLDFTLNYNASTHKITGTFSGTIDTNDNSTGNNMTITNGTFESSVVEIVQRPSL